MADLATLRKDVLDNLLRGVSKDDIRLAAKTQKWTDEEIDRVFVVLGDTRKSKITTSPLDEAEPVAKKKVISIDPVKDVEDAIKAGRPIREVIGLEKKVQDEDVLANLYPRVKMGATLTSAAAAGLAAPAVAPFLTKAAPLIANIAGSTVYEGTGALNKDITKDTSGSLVKNIFPEYFESGNAPSVSGAALSILEGEALSRIATTAFAGAKAIGKAAKEYAKPGSVVGDLIAKISPTLRGYFELTPNADIITTTIPSAQKRSYEVDKEVGKKLRTTIEDFIEDSTGVKVLIGGVSGVDDTAIKATQASLGQTIQKIRNETFYALTNEAGKYGDDVIKQAGKLEFTPKKLEQVSAELKSELLERLKLSASTEKPYSLADDIFRQAFQINDAGDVVAKPMTIETAWKLKKDLGDLAFGAPNIELSQVRRRLAPLYSALDDDIETALAFNAPALGSYRKAKMLTNQRHMLFNPGGKVTSITRFNLDNVKANEDFIENPFEKARAIIKDPVMLKDSLVSHIISIDGKRIPLQAKNVSKSYAAIDMQDVFNTAFRKDKFGNTFFESEAFQNAWDDPAMAASRKILYPTREARDGIEQVLRTLGMASKKTGESGHMWLKLKIGSSGLGAGIGLLNMGLLGGSSMLPILAGGIPLVAFLSAEQLSKIITSQGTARLLAAALRGAPLGTSEKVAARALMLPLKGEIIQLMGTDETIKATAKVSEDGSLKDVQETK